MIGGESPDRYADQRVKHDPTSSGGLSRRELLKRAAVGGAALPIFAAPATAARTILDGKKARKKKRDSLVVLEAEVAPGADWDGAQVANPGSQELEAQTYELLIGSVRRENNGVFVPNVHTFVGRLVKSWEKKGLEWTFHLRKGVKSCAGNEFTADDLIWTFARAKSVSGAVPCAWFLANAASILRPDVFAKNATPKSRRLKGEVVKVDPYTVKFKQFEPNENFPATLSVFCLNIVDSKEAQKHATAADPWAHSWLDTKGTAGFGAYCLTSWEKEVSITLKANPNYYRGQPQFTTVNIRKVPQSATRLAALLSGAADVVTGLAPQEFDKVKKSGKAKVLSWFGNKDLAMGLNYEAEPWGGGGDRDKARLLRQAVAHALPYDLIVKKDFFDQARKWNGQIDSSFYGAKQYPGRYTTDVNKAKQLLAKAGYPNGQGLGGPGLSLTYVAERQSLLEPVATDIRTALAGIGINIDLNPIPNAQFVDRLLTKRDLPLYLDDEAITIVADAGYASQNLYVSTKNGGFGDQMHYSSDAFDSLFLQQKTLTGKKRLKLLGAMQDMLMNDLPRIPIVERATQVAVRKELTGWSPRLDKGMDFWSFKSV